LKDLREQPWWTHADRAELDALAHELVKDVLEHREAGCPTCAAGDPPCPAVRKAITLVVEWREARVLLSRARWERCRQDWLDEVARKVTDRR
jgi:hypothetical protein